MCDKSFQNLQQYFFLSPDFKIKSSTIFLRILNLAISKSSSIQTIRNCVGLMMEIISFFNMSSKRNFVLKKILNGNPHLISLCETRWVERHDSVMLFKSSLPYIIKALTLISNWQEHNSSSKAKMLLTSLCKCEFVVGIFSL